MKRTTAWKGFSEEKKTCHGLLYMVIDIGHIKQSSSKYEQYLLKCIIFSIFNFTIYSVDGCCVSISIYQVVCIEYVCGSTICNRLLVRSFEFNYINVKVHMAVEEDKYLWFVLLLCGLRGETENNVSDSCNVWGIINISKHQCLIYHSEHTP